MTHQWITLGFWFQFQVFQRAAYKNPTCPLRAHQSSCLDDHSGLWAVLRLKDSTPICARVTFSEHRSHHVPFLLNTSVPFPWPTRWSPSSKSYEPSRPWPQLTLVLTPAHPSPLLRCRPHEQLWTIPLPRIWAFLLSHLYLYYLPYLGHLSFSLHPSPNLTKSYESFLCKAFHNPEKCQN